MYVEQSYSAINKRTEVFKCDQNYCIEAHPLSQNQHRRWYKAFLRIAGRGEKENLIFQILRTCLFSLRSQERTFEWLKSSQIMSRGNICSGESIKLQQNRMMW